MGAGTGFVVGNHTIITNKHVTYHMKVGDEIKAHPNGFYNNGGGLYKVTKIVDYPGKEDIAVVQVEEKSTQPKGRKFKDFTSKFNIASEAKENEPISVIGYPNPNGNKLQMYESTGKVSSNACAFLYTSSTSFSNPSVSLPLYALALITDCSIFSRLFICVILHKNFIV